MVIKPESFERFLVICLIDLEFYEISRKDRGVVSEDKILNFGFLSFFSDASGKIDGGHQKIRTTRPPC